MIKSKFTHLFDAFWLPFLLLVSTSWLYAPWVHRATAGHLALISLYETNGASLATIFKAGDIVGALIILAVIWRISLIKQQKWLGRTLLAAALLMIVDDIFAAGCLHQCSVWAQIGVHIHDIESVVSALVLAFATGIDALRNRSTFSRLFLGAQVLTAVAIFVPFVTRQDLVFCQYIYQVFVLVWIAYILHRYSAVHARVVSARSIRLVLAVLVFLFGLIELVLAFHVRAYGRIPGELVSRREPVWLAEHGVIAGVALLYLSRFVYKGERRAAILIGVITATLIVKYALLTPNIILLLLGEVLALALFVGWPAFDRNIGVPTVVSKLKSLLITLVGVVLALALLFVLTFAANRNSELLQDTRQFFGVSATKIADASDHEEDHVEYRIRHIRFVGTGLGISIVAIAMWSLFRPAGRKDGDGLPAKQAIRLLDAYAASSEDYFKVWPTDKSYFTNPNIDGFVAYKQVGGTVFALADPIAPTAKRQQLLSLFANFCRQHGWSMCFLVVDKTSVAMYERAGLSSLRIGANAVVSVEQFSTTTVRDKWWRWQLNRAAKAGMSYSVSQPPHDQRLLAETQQVSDAWLQRAGHGEQGFALGYYDVGYLQQCTLHMLRNDVGELVAFSNQLPIYNQLQQATVDLIRFRPDVNGAMPVLIAHIIMGLAEDRIYRTFDLGFVPLAKVDNIAVTIAKYVAAGRFSADGLEQFKSKFKPEWYPQYLAYEGDIIDLTALFTRLERAMKVEPSDEPL